MQRMYKKEKETKLGKKNSSLVIFLPGEVKLELVWIEPGTFLMGSPEDELGRYDNEVQHEVTLTKGYWLGKYEVTQAQYQTIMGKNPSLFKGADLPVDSVDCDNAQMFCIKLMEIEKEAGRLPEGYEYTLPTEAQWEYACRAGTTTALNSGKNLSDHFECPEMDEVGWYLFNSDKKTHPVGQKQPNAWGLYDMHGNVWEWCLDWCYDDDYYEIRDHVIRGGGYDIVAQACRSAYRHYYPSYWRNYGFRVALAPVQ